MGRFYRTLRGTYVSRSSFLKLFALTTLLIVTACGSADTSVVEAPDLRYTVTLGDTRDIPRAGPLFEVTTDNCGSPASTYEILTKSRTFSTEIELTLTESIIGEVGGGVPAVAEARLSAQVEASLGIQIGTTETTEAARKLETPGNSKSTHTLQWQQIWSQGTISVQHADGTQIGQVPFLVLTSLNLTQVNVETEQCLQTPTSSTSTAETVASPTSTSLLPTDTPKPVLPTLTNTPPPRPTATDTPPPPPCDSGLICYEVDFSELDPELWCKIPPNQLYGGQLQITARGSTEDTRYELQPCPGLGRSLRFIELTIKITTADGPPGNAHAGIQADSGNGGYFFFSLDSGGNGYIDPGVPNQDKRFPLGGLNTARTLLVKWTGQEVIFSVDGSQLKTRLATEGFGNWFLLHATAYQGGTITAEFDNVRWGVAPP